MMINYLHLIQSDFLIQIIDYFKFYRSEFDVSQINELLKQKRDLEVQLEELREDFNNEKDLRVKAERARRDLSGELENIKTEYAEVVDKATVSIETRRKKDEQLKSLQV